ncbi:MAG: hypothetical protein PWR19_1860 [Carnobacterium sp.]|uniref:hypothetical protein n=1 Tax=Carnobacterium sp. TaxID=48221 RepID=UPI0026486C47|nr:hypothetical protein [Carnobacterium sp.]MDN5372814.1 hypothetical protein [Carnobacterium sp.]
MLKNGLFIMTIGFIAVILGLTSLDEHRIIILGIGILLIVLGFILYNTAEKKED